LECFETGETEIDEGGEEEGFGWGEGKGGIVEGGGRFFFFCVLWGGGGVRRDSVGERGRMVSYKERGSFFIFGFLEGEGREEEREVVVVVVVVEVEVEVEVVVEVVGEGFPSSECLGKLRARERSRLVVLVLLKVSHSCLQDPKSPRS
jgi:hypothetical protein